MTQQTVNPDATSDDKLWSALGYPVFVIAIVMLLMDDKKNRPFIKFHAVQALALNVVVWVAATILAITVVGAFCAPILWLGLIWPAVLAYQGKNFEIPVLTNLLKGWGWI